MSQLPEPTSTPGPALPGEPSARPLGVATLGDQGPALAAGSSPIARAPSSGRLAIGAVVGAVAAALGGWILGEYPFTGLTPFIAGVLFGLVVAEVIVSVSRRHDAVTAAVAALWALGGLGLSVWISTGEGLDPIPIGGWTAMAIGAVVALWRGGFRPIGRRAPSSPPPP